MKEKGVLFDFNGTLFFDAKYHKLAWDQIIEELTNNNLSKERLALIHGKTNHQVIKILRPEFTKQQCEYYSQKKETFYRSYCMEDSMQLVDGAIQYFETLKRNGIPFTIVTASPKGNVDFFFEIFELDRWFDIDKVFYDTGDFIDKIAMYQNAAIAIGTTISQTIVYEDSKSGIQEAINAGCKHVVGIGPKNDHERLKQLGVVDTIENFTEVLI